MELGDEKVIASYSIKLKNKIKVREKANKQNVSKSEVVDELIENIEEAN